MVHTRVLILPLFYKRKGYQFTVSPCKNSDHLGFYQQCNVLSDYIIMSDITKTLMLHVTLKSRICIYSVKNIIILLFDLVHMAAILDFAIFRRLKQEIILGS